MRQAGREGERREGKKGRKRKGRPGVGEGRGRGKGNPSPVHIKGRREQVTLAGLGAWFSCYLQRVLCVSLQEKPLGGHYNGSMVPCMVGHRDGGGTQSQTGALKRRRDW